MITSRVFRVVSWGACLLLGAGGLVPAVQAQDRCGCDAPTASRNNRVALSAPLAEPEVLTKQAQEEVLYCFESQLTALVNPGCFTTGPGQGGDCASHNTHYMAQFFDPVAVLGQFTGSWRVTEVAFLTNDGDTVWPSVGVVLLPWDSTRFPNQMELESLQVKNIASPGDTAEVLVDLRPADIQFTVDHILYMVVQFPEGGVLTAPLVGPGIVADEMPPDPNCDFFTQDSGGSWFRPNPDTDPLDWGFAVVIEPVVAVEENDWGSIKLLYRPGSQAVKR